MENQILTKISKLENKIVKLERTVITLLKALQKTMNCTYKEVVSATDEPQAELYTCDCNKQCSCTHNLCECGECE